MSCPDEMKIEMLLNGALPEDEAGRLERHLRECRKCGAVYDEMKSLDRLLEAAAPELPVGEYLKSLSAEIKKGIGGRNGRTKPYALVFTKLFWGVTEAAAAFIIAATIWALVSGGRPNAIKYENDEIIGIKSLALVQRDSSVNRENVILIQRKILTSQL